MNRAPVPRLAQDALALVPEGWVEGVGVEALVVETVDDVDGGAVVAGVVLDQQRLRVNVVAEVLAALGGAGRPVDRTVFESLDIGHHSRVNLACFLG